MSLYIGAFQESKACVSNESSADKASATDRSDGRWFNELTSPDRAGSSPTKVECPDAETFVEVGSLFIQQRLLNHEMSFNPKLNESPNGTLPVSVNSLHSGVLVQSHSLAARIAEPVNAALSAGLQSYQFVVALPGLADISVRTLLQIQGGHSIQLGTDDLKLRNWLKGQQYALAETLSELLQESVNLSLKDDDSLPGMQVSG